MPLSPLSWCAIAFSIADHFNWPRNELYAVGIILIALTLVRLFTDEMKNRFWARILATAIWVLCLSLDLSQSFPFHRLLAAFFARC